jgi:hypothetical protein
VRSSRPSANAASGGDRTGGDRTGGPAAAGKGADPSAAPTAATSPASPPSAPQERAPARLPQPLDLDSLRARLPDNRYWALAAPTDDPEVLRSRELAARAENVLYGKVLSGTATDEEIEHYFDERRRTLSDYAEVARAVLADDQISERDRSLFELALRMDQDRLAALPAEKDAAVARQKLQAERRAAWKAQNR